MPRIEERAEPAREIVKEAADPPCRGQRSATDGVETPRQKACADKCGRCSDEAKPVQRMDQQVEGRPAPRDSPPDQQQHDCSADEPYTLERIWHGRKGADTGSERQKRQPCRCTQKAVACQPGQGY